MGKRVAIYLRVSTNGQTTENQLRDLQAVAEKAGWQVVRICEDAGISGSKGRDGRPALDCILKAAARREFDILAAWSVDRLGRSLADLAETFKTLHELGVGLYLHKQGFDTTTASGRAMFGMMAVFAEFEREIIRERVNAGIARARSQGRRLGRPKAKASVEKAILEKRAEGMGKQKIARELGVGVSTVMRVLAENEAA